MYQTKIKRLSPSQVNAGLGSNTDIATTNIYNYMVEPIKTIDIKKIVIWKNMKSYLLLLV